MVILGNAIIFPYVHTPLKAGQVSRSRGRDGSAGGGPDDLGDITNRLHGTHSHGHIHGLEGLHWTRHHRHHWPWGHWHDSDGVLGQGSDRTVDRHEGRHNVLSLLHVVDGHLGSCLWCRRRRWL